MAPLVHRFFHRGTPGGGCSSYKSKQMYVCEWLKGPTKVQPKSTFANGFPFASVDLVEKVRHMGLKMETGWEQMDWPRQGEIWVRWGLDTLPVWDTSYMTLTCAFTGRHENLNSFL